LSHSSYPLWLCIAVIFCEAHDYWTVWLCNFLKSPDSLFHLHLNITISSLVLKSFKLCSLKARDQVPHANITSKRNRLSCVFQSLILDNERDVKITWTEYI
jgi:hypothetical protein